MDRIKGLYYNLGSRGLCLRSFTSFRMTDGGTLKTIVRNCILVVYQLAFDDVTCYNACSSNLQTSSPSSPAITF